MDISLLAGNPTGMLVAGLFTLTSRFSTEICRELLCFDGSIREGEKAWHMGAVKISQSVSVSLLLMLMHVYSRVFANQEISKRTTQRGIDCDAFMCFSFRVTHYCINTIPLTLV